MSKLNEADGEFLFSRLSELADGELTDANVTKCNQLITSYGDPRLVDRYRATRGKLQLALQAYYLSEDENVALQDFVADRQVRETQEAQRIDEIGKWETHGEVRRKVTIVAAVIVAIFGIVYFMTPPKAKKLNPLDYFGYEAKTFEDEPEGRFDLPSQDFGEVSAYFASYPGLGFAAKPPAPAPGWGIFGASVLDYEVTKVATVAYRNDNKKDSLYFFSYKGSLSDLPKTEPGNEQGLIYQVYASDNFNLLAWQQEEGIVSFLVGHLSAKDLATFAKGSAP